MVYCRVLSLHGGTLNTVLNFKKVSLVLGNHHMYIYIYMIVYVYTCMCIYIYICMAKLYPVAFCT